MSNAPRKVECELVRAQNGLLAQSIRDERGLSNPDGWGLGSYLDHHPIVKRQARAAFESEEFRWAAAEVHSRDVMAHVRRATIGRNDIANTHPFGHGDWLLSHNGDLGAFDAIRPKMIDAMGALHRDTIEGQTDSEHGFHLLLSIRDRMPGEPLTDVVRKTITQIRAWSLEADPDAEVALNLLLTDGKTLVGSRYGRTLWYVTRRAVHPCEVCGGALHIDKDPGSSYRAVVIASEPITSDEKWVELPEASVLQVDEAIELHVEAL